MRKILKITGIITSVVCGLIIILLAVLYFISPPHAGKEIAAKKGLPYNMVVAHRGASHYAPENTIPAFIIAAELGADYIECDVQRSRDGILFIFHDRTPERTTNAATVFPGREKDLIGSFTYSELMMLDAGSWFNEKNPSMARDSYRGIKICTFKEYIIAVSTRNRPALLIELKHPELYPGIEKEVIDILAKHGRLKMIGEKPDMVQSFDRNSLIKCRELAPELHRNFLVNEKGEEETEWDERGWAGLLDDAVTAGCEIGPSGHLGWPWNTGRAHDRELLVIMYTIDKDIHFRLLSWFGTDWFITNRCDRALEFFGRTPQFKAEKIMEKYNF